MDYSKAVDIEKLKEYLKDNASYIGAGVGLIALGYFFGSYRTVPLHKRAFISRSGVIFELVRCTLHYCGSDSGF